MPDFAPGQGPALLVPILWAVASRRVPSDTPLARFLWYFAVAALVVALVAGVMWARHVWQGLHETEEPASNEEMLDELRRAYAAGTMSEAEFHKISARLAGNPIGSERPGPTAPPRVHRPERPAADDDSGGDSPAGTAAEPS